MIAPAGRKLGNYEIRQKLGRGGMADVYLAQDTAGGFPVALKLIEHSADSDTIDSIAAERRGAELQARLAAIEPRVTRVYAAGDVDGIFYIAMEYIDGQDLAELLRRGPLAVGFAVEAAISVARALESAHGLEVTIAGREIKGIVHGDIKPKNIRVTSRGEVRILDFGIAKALTLSRRLTRNEFGSVPYASPERLESGEVDVHSDLWSLAVMLYEMVTGMQPYQAETTERLERMIRSHIPPPPAPDPCPELLRFILMKALSPEVSQRYESAREFAEDLQSFQTGGAVRAEGEDLDSTRRTFRRDFDDTYRSESGAGAGEDETRRTKPQEKGKPATWPLRKRSGWRALSRGMRAVAILATVCVGIGVWDAAAKYRLYEQGKALQQQIEEERLTDPDEIWNKWWELSKSNPSSILLSGARAAVRTRLIADANHVIVLFGKDQAQPLKDWEHAREMLARALSLDADDTVRGELRLCEGHVDRIVGLYQHDRKELVTAEEKFNEAVRLLPNSPDPQLALAQLYVYGMKELDKAYDALREAARLGHPIGEREKQQLADGYTDRADQLFADSKNVRGLPQEKDEIDRAAADYNRALELYQGIEPYGHSTKSAARVQSSMEAVTGRLGEIQSGGKSPTR
ncbi:MAG TPA: serine/threonine-protein kinase [Verrucomicrobiae bacterium]|nr:serine/threonine-protein kinase [Verrucomicrobiae bacterium]